MSSLRVLFVEDSENDVHLILNVLSKGGFEVAWERVQTASDMEQKLKKDWDIILCDYVMPSFDAPAAIKLAREVNAFTPLIVVSGTVGEDIAVETLKLGASDYLLKDNLVRLVPAIKRAMHENKLRLEAHQNATRIKEQAALLAKASDAIFLLNAEGKVTFWNKSAENIYGWSEKEILGQSYREFTNPCIEVIDEAFDILHREGEWSGELQDHTKSGDKITVESRWTLLDDPPNDTQSILVLNSDITEKKELQQQIAQTQRLESIGTLTSGIAHDFNNILTIIIGQAEVALMTLDKDNPARVSMQEIYDAGDRAAALTRQLLAFSRKGISSPEEIQLNDFIQSMQRLLSRVIAENIKIEIKLEPDLPLVRVDPSQIEQVIMNLVVNARDSMPDGGTLTLRTSKQDINANTSSEFKTIPPGKYVLLEVADTGSGIPPEIQQRMFEPFFTSKQEGKGTGLGLSTVYGILSQNRSHITYHTGSGQGTTFQVSLPALKNKPASLEPASEEPSVVGGTETILLVEDDDMVRKLTSVALKKFDYKVVAATTPMEALEIIENQRDDIQLLLTDVVMPEMNGFELAEKIKAMRPQLPVLFMSGYTQQALLEKHHIDANNNFITKPFKLPLLMHKIRELLDRVPTTPLKQP
jgi:hypothetical protein